MVLLGCRIKELREKNKFTQTELAQKVNVTKSTIAAYENDSRMPSYEVLIRLASLFKVSLDYLVLNRKDEKKVDVSELTIEQVDAIKNLISCFEIDNKELKNHGYIFVDDNMSK